MKKFLSIFVSLLVYSLSFAQFAIWSNGEIIFQVEKDKVDSIVFGQSTADKPEESFLYDNVYLYGNCTDPINNREDGRFGMNSAYVMATATLMNGAELAAHGTKIIGVRALIDGEVSDSEVYVTDNLDSLGVRKSFSWVDEGWQYILFDEPVEITGKDLYVGYKISASGYVIGFESSKTAVETEMMWWNNNWYKLSDMGTKGRWSIQAILQGGDYSAETQYAISIDNLSMPKSVRANSKLKTILEIRNIGVRTISGVDVVVNVAGVESVIPVEKVLINGQTAKVEVMMPIGDVEGNVDIKLKAQIKGQNVVTEEYSASVEVFGGLERNAILIEQFTGQGCPNCPAGATAIKKSISELVDSDKVCWVAHHTYLGGDAFTISASNDITSALNVTNYPMCNVDRRVIKYEDRSKEALIWHPAAMTSSLLASLITTSASATMTLVREFNEETRELKVKVSGYSLKDVAYITIIVNQDNMKSYQSGASGDYYHTAPRKFLTAGVGDKLTLDAEGNYSVEYTYTIPEKVGSFECVLKDMEVVAFIHGDIKDTNNREIYNADHIDILGE